MKTKEIFKELKDMYGIIFDLDETPKYEIIDDMNNIEGLFSMLKENLENE